MLPCYCKGTTWGDPEMPVTPSFPPPPPHLCKFFFFFKQNTAWKSTWQPDENTVWHPPQLINPGYVPVLSVFQCDLDRWWGGVKPLALFDQDFRQLFRKTSVVSSMRPKEWSSLFINFFDSHQRHKIDEVLKEMGVEKQTSESDIEVLQRVCAAVSIRAARLAAAGIASIAKVCIVNL